MPKFGTKNAWFGYFWTGIWKQYCHIWNQHPQKINSLFNLTTHNLDIGKIYLYAKDPYEGKYQLLINKKSKDLKHLKYFKCFYWILEWYGWYLSKYSEIQSK